MSQNKAGFDEKEFRKQERELIRKKADELIPFGEQINKKIRKESTLKFFQCSQHIPVKGQSKKPTQGGKHENIINALSFHYKSRWKTQQNGADLLEIKFFSEIDLDKYKPPTSLSAQVRKGYYPNMKESPSEFVLGLQWDQGITGLPRIFSYKTVGGERIRREGDEIYNESFFKNARSMEQVVATSYNLRLTKEFKKLVIDVKGRK